jgi:hypothetical protein
MRWWQNTHFSRCLFDWSACARTGRCRQLIPQGSFSTVDSRYPHPLPNIYAPFLIVLFEPTDLHLHERMISDADRLSPFQISLPATLHALVVLTAFDLIRSDRCLRILYSWWLVYRCAMSETGHTLYAWFSHDYRYHETVCASKTHLHRWLTVCCLFRW